MKFADPNKKARSLALFIREAAIHNTCVIIHHGSCALGLLQTKGASQNWDLSFIVRNVREMSLSDPFTILCFLSVDLCQDMIHDTIVAFTPNRRISDSSGVIPPYLQIHLKFFIKDLWLMSPPI